MDNLPCVDCNHQDDCELYSTMDRTLNKEQKFAKLKINMEFILNPKDMDDFKAAWSEIMAKDIAKGSAELAVKVCDIIGDNESRILPLGAELDVETLENKETFNLVSEYIRATHE